MATTTTITTSKYDCFSRLKHKGDRCVVLADLKHAMKAADDELLQVELGRDAQKQRLLQRIRRRRERPRIGATCQRRQHWCFDLAINSVNTHNDQQGSKINQIVRIVIMTDFGETIDVFELSTNERDDLRAQLEALHDVRMRQQIDVALRVEQMALLVLELPRQQTGRLPVESMREHRQLAAWRLAHSAVARHDVAAPQHGPQSIKVVELVDATHQLKLQLDAAVVVDVAHREERQRRAAVATRYDATLH